MEYTNLILNPTVLKSVTITTDAVGRYEGSPRLDSVADRSWVWEHGLGLKVEQRGFSLDTGH